MAIGLRHPANHLVAACVYRSEDSRVNSKLSQQEI
jgi:hypothetical protein